MKRMTALALALLLLLSGTAAFGETVGTRLDLKSLKLTELGADGGESVRFHGLGFSVSVGTPEGVPTLQTTLGYDDGQQLESVLQIVDNRLLLCLGGISGTYYVDLDALTGDPAQTALVRTAVGAALGMFAAKPELVLDMSMPKDENGVRKLTRKFSRKEYRAAAETVLGLLGGLGDVAEESAEALREAAYASKRKAKLALRYYTDSGKLRVRLTRDGEGLELKANMTITTEPMEFIDLTADPEPHDLLNLDEQTLTNLRDEMDFLSMKYDFFAKNTHLDKLAE